MQGILVVEDGHFFRGELFGADAGGEVVFNTSATGYQEILTDPSYEGQIVTLTTAHVGNYGVNADDVESRRPYVAGLVVRDYHPTPSNWRSTRALDDYLREAGIPAIAEVDTRALVLHIREAGALRGTIQRLPEGLLDLPRAGTVASAPDRLAPLLANARAVPSMAGLDLAGRVTSAAPWTAGADDAPLHVVALDFGIKHNIVRQLAAAGCRVTVVPATTTAEAVLALAPDGVFLSNGPGDPEPVTYAAETIRRLLGRVPIFGICLGHQLLAIACGGRTYKLHFGHRGANHPVREVGSRRVEITSQNHGFAVDPESLPAEVEVTHWHLNDRTVAGIRSRIHPAFSVQFHPEASPGPHDSHHLFRRFVELMEARG